MIGEPMRINQEPEMTLGMQVTFSGQAAYLCSISSPVTQKEIRGEAYFMCASCFVKLTHSEHLMFPLSVKKLKIKILCEQIVF